MVKPQGATKSFGFCCLCRSRCGATFTLDNGKLIAVGPNPDHPTGKALCLKGKAAPEILYSPDRILYPLRRTNPKTASDPGWQRISWEAALMEVAGKMSVELPNYSELQDTHKIAPASLRKSGEP